MKSVINSKHYLALAVSGIIFLCSIGAFAFVYYRIGAQLQNTDAAYSEMAQAQEIESQANSVISTLSTTQTQRAQLQLLFVRDDQTVNFITNIEAVGQETGEASVTIATISDDDLSADPVGATGNMYAHIDIDGPWAQAMRSLHLIESLPYSESMDNLRIVPTSAKAWNIQFDLTAVLIHE